MVSDSELNDEYIGAQMRLQAARTWRRPESSRTLITASTSSDGRRADTGDQQALDARAFSTTRQVGAGLALADDPRRRF